jgi:catechol 2,3-dioxygenase-like lactoylglutathione lyase family enzyme
MEQRVQLVTLGAKDMAASRRFYIDGLGWEPLLELDDVLFFQVGHGLVLSLFDNDHLAADTGFADPERAAAQEPTRLTLGYNPASEVEVDEALRRAEAAGGTILKPAQRAFWGGYHGFVADPDGFAWEIAYNPGLVFAADGTVAFTEPE